MNEMTGAGSAADGGNPRVSVITIFRNEERYLGAAIESVLAQTCTNWELLLVDDGSNDGSPGVAAAHAGLRPDRIRCLHHAGRENRGMSASRNLGLREARGEYIAFLDGDDVYLPDRLQRHLDVLERMPAVDFVQSDLVHWHSWNDQKQRRSDDYVRPPVCFADRVIAAPLALRTIVELPELYAGVCSLTVRRATALRIGGFEDRFRGLYEDQVFVTKLYAATTGYVVEDYLARYRIHPDSTVERLRRSTRQQAAAARRLEAEFAAWRLHYLQSQSSAAGPLAEIVNILASRPSGTETGAGAMLAAARACARRALAWLLPARAERSLNAWRRRRAGRLTVRRYQQLCAELGDVP